MPASCERPFARPSSCGSRCTRGTLTRARTGRPPACPIQLRQGTLPHPTSTTIATRPGARRGSTRQHASRHRRQLEVPVDRPLVQARGCGNAGHGKPLACQLDGPVPVEAPLPDATISLYERQVVFTDRQRAREAPEHNRVDLAAAVVGVVALRQPGLATATSWL